MFNNLKMNSRGQATITAINCWMDGGSVSVVLEAVDDQTCEIWFKQKMLLTISEQNPNPGALLFNNELIEIRSDLEQKALNILKKAIFLNNVKFTEKEILETCILFVESKDYILLSEKWKRK
jgi:hypothetical protein